MPNIKEFFTELEVNIDINTPQYGVEIEQEKLIPKNNIIDQIDDDTLRKVGDIAVEGYESDLETMKNWTKYVEDGIKLSMPTSQAKNTPYDNSSNFKSPVLLIGVHKFADPVSTEIFRSDDMVKTQIIGEFSDEKEAIADAYATYANYQLNNEMLEWRVEHEKLIYDMPLVGTCFKKVFFNSEEQKLESRLITYPDFALNNNQNSMYRLRRFSEIMNLASNEVEERFRLKLWTRTDLNAEDEDMEGTEEDGYEKFIEQQCWSDLDDDGYEEPYTLVVHCESRKVVRITPRYEYDNIVFDGDDVAKIAPKVDIVKYGFLKDPEGGLLDIGYAHLLGSLVKGINTTVNQLVDAGKLANLQGGFLARGFKKKGNVKANPGQYIPTDMQPNDLQNSILPYSFKEPSQTLYALMSDMVGAAQEISASTNLIGAIGANAPAATTLSLLTEQQQSRSAIVLRLHRSMTEEFKMLYELNKLYIDPEEYQKITSIPPIFDNFMVMPNANPDTSSKVVRVQQAAAAMQTIEQVLIAGGDAKPIIKSFLEAINFDDVDSVIPDSTPDEQLKKLFEQNPELMQMVMGEKERADALTAEQMDAIAADEAREDNKEAREDAKVAKDIELKDAQVVETLESAKLKGEQSQTEDLKNDALLHTTAQQIDKVSTENEFKKADTERLRIDNDIKAVKLARGEVD